MQVLLPTGSGLRAQLRFTGSGTCLAPVRVPVYGLGSGSGLRARLRFAGSGPVYGLRYVRARLPVRGSVFGLGSGLKALVCGLGSDLQGSVHARLRFGLRFTGSALVYGF